MRIPTGTIAPGIVIAGLLTYALVAIPHAKPSSGSQARDRTMRTTTPPSPAGVNTLAGDIAPPPATAPLVQRERWVILQSAPSAPRHLLSQWLKLCEPPLYWSPFAHYYYFWVNVAQDRAATLPYVSADNDPAWYGQPLRP